MKKIEIEQMLKLQEKLDYYILSNRQVTDLNGVILRNSFALENEFHEFHKELGLFKHWKKNKSDIDAQKEECIDIFHFIYSLIIFNHKNNIATMLTQKQINDILDLDLKTYYSWLLKYNQKIESLTKDYRSTIFFNQEFKSLTYNQPLTTKNLFKLLAFCEVMYEFYFASRDIYTSYEKKITINYNRQKNNY